MGRISINQMLSALYDIFKILVMTEMCVTEWSQVADKHVANFKTDLCDMK